MGTGAAGTPNATHKEFWSMQRSLEATALGPIMFFLGHYGIGICLTVKENAFEVI